MLLMIDNYDSFTHNIVHYLSELGAAVEVVRHDQIEVADIAALPLRGLVISPGPGTPNDAGITLAAIAAFAGKLPMLGICLGHQAIGQHFGAQVVRAEQVMHGKTSALEHNGDGLFTGLPSPFNVARYHSLVLAPETIPVELLVDAWATNALGHREVMAVRHQQWPIWGLQYHPEAIETEYGHAVLRQFLRHCGYPIDT